MNQQKGFIQLLVSVLIIAILMTAVVYYLQTMKITTERPNGNNEQTTDSAGSPQNIIDQTKENIESLEKDKEQQLQDYLNNL